MFLVLYATLLFLLAVILVPTRLSVVVDSWEYFLSIRYWFYGGLLVLNGIDLVDSFMKGTEWGFRTNNLVYWAALTATAIISLLNAAAVRLDYGTSGFQGESRCASSQSL